MKKIKLGYELKTGKEVNIKPSHLIVTGVTQKSGKTTTLEALIKRSGLKAIVFRTKIGEKSFIEGSIIPPYFKDRSDWQFIQGLIEATIKEKLRSFERAKIIQLCKISGNSLLGFKKAVDNRLLEKINTFEKDILTNIQAYLEIVLPKLQTMTFSNELNLVSGINIIDLERFSRDDEVQSLIIRSVAEEVLHNHKGIILVLPEAWKFLPQKRGNPCKQIVEEFIRQGATNNNYIWIDSQDQTGVDKTPLKQVSTWILGYQAERNEVKHTIDQIPLPKNQKPKTDEIMNLGTGKFILATREQTVKVYVQPFWLNNDKAIQIAKGKLNVSEIDVPKSISPFKIAIKKEEVTQQEKVDLTKTAQNFQKELNEMANDFWAKIGDIQEQLSKIYNEIYSLKNKPKKELDEETIIRKVLQKVPLNNNLSQSINIDEEALINKILARVPQSTGNKVYEVAPLEKIKKDFLQEAKNKILKDVNSLDEEQKKILKFVETQNKGCSQTHILSKCLYVSATSGGTRKRISDKCKEMFNLEIIRMDKNSVVYASLKDRIKSLIGIYEATEQEIQGVYEHILMEVLKKPIS